MNLTRTFAKSTKFWFTYQRSRQFGPLLQNFIRRKLQWNGVQHSTRRNYDNVQNGFEKVPV